jgi:hypothetical protein
MAAPTASVSANSQKITNLGTPTLGTDAVTKTYADAIGVIVQEDNVQEGTGIKTLDFTGSGVDVVVTGTEAVVTITGGGGGTPADAAPPAVGTASVVGTGTDYAREDHTHAGVAPSSAAGLTPTKLFVGATDPSASAVNGDVWVQL